jgi:MauM/NapG family ferredoxin protein
MRRFIQALSFSLFVLLFVLADYRLASWFPVDLYLRLDPLLGLTAILAQKEMISRAVWSLLIVGATVGIGRFFCGYVCPMGTALDFVDASLLRKKARPGLKNEGIWRQAKYFSLVFLLSSAFAGLILTHFLDPLALLTRFFTFFLYPLVVALINFSLDLFRPLFRVMGWVDLTYLRLFQPVFYTSLLTLLLFAVIASLNLLTPRFWCRYLCPLGALLSLLSPLGIFKRSVSPACNQCRQCQRICSMGAVEENPQSTTVRECIQCRSCVQVCPPHAISFPGRLPAPKPAGESVPVNFSRRGFLFSMTSGLAFAFTAQVSPFQALQGKRQLIRPPGAVPEGDFLGTCIRCGECMKACLTNTLQPTHWDLGLKGLWTPRMELRLAPCEQNCNVCGQVCPTQAIRKLSLQEKNHAKVGTAILLKEKCLVWAQDKICLICDEICPYNAIVFRTVEGARRPVVIPSKCNGCGFCEQRCPVQGDAAIVVVPHGEIRLKEGSYVQEAKKRQLDFRPDPGDDRYILEQSGIKIEGTGPVPSLPPAQPSAPPKGFLPN